MAKERCVKKSFQDSLEDIKERMKEKRTKKLAKVATVNKGLSSKVKILNNSSVTVKSFQANNKALALALEAEKSKCRQAQDLILHLKREHQRLMYEIFILRRKLNMQQRSSSSDAKLTSLKEIIAKVTHNLLETANLLGPAHALCSTDGSAASTPAPVEVPLVAPEPLAQTHETRSYAQRDFSRSERASNPGRSRRPEEPSEKMTSGSRISKVWASSASQPKSDLERPESEDETDNSFLRNVSIRRRASSLNVCIEEPPMVTSLEEEQNPISRCDVPEDEIIAPVVKCCNDEVMDVSPDQSPSKEEIIPFTNHSQISSSTPEPKPKKSQSLKGKTETGREKGRKGRADVQVTVQLKKPWEKSKPRARSKSRERGAGKPTISKEKMNSSLNSGDAYDFVCEESIHITPFRPTKPGTDPEEGEEVTEESMKSTSSSDEELNDSLYVPNKAKAKSQIVEQKRKLPLRPRSKRNKDLPPQRCAERTEVKGGDLSKQEVVRGKKTTRIGLKGSVETEGKFSVPEKTTEGSKENVMLPKCIKIEETVKLSIDEQLAQDLLVHSTDRNISDFEGTSVTQRISLSDVTNLSASSGSTESKKHSYPFTEDNRKISGGCMRKRRCTVTVNYAEPSLSKKLRRGDPFTDTEFLLSPIFKDGNPKRKSLNRKSLVRYNEAFVGCR